MEQTCLIVYHDLDVPDAPLNVIVGNVTKFGCTVSWEPPESDGGSPITSYIIELRDRTSVKWSPVQVSKADELTAIVNDVIENKEYIFRVKAENKAGVGKPSAASQPVKIMDPIGELGRHSDWSVKKKGCRHSSSTSAKLFIQPGET